MKVQRVKIAEYQYVWLVLDDKYLSIQPIEAFIRYLQCTEKSPETLRSYAFHLKSFWEYLFFCGKNWVTLNIHDFAEFVHWLRTQKNDLKRDYKRTEKTINTIFSSLASFYRYHRQLGHTNIQLLETCYLPGNKYKSLLYHVFKNKPKYKRIISLKVPKILPKKLIEDQINLLMEACGNLRDRFLVALLYETGLRIGQAIGLRHTDIKSWSNEIHIIFRQDNENQSRNKSRAENILQVSPSLMKLYTEYLEWCCPAKNDYVLIDLIKKSPLDYGCVRNIFSRLSKKVGFYVRPHMLRHTHASELVKAGWDMSWVQKRLGHKSVQTTIDTYTHLDNQDLKEAFKLYQSNKKNKTGAR